MNCTHPTEPFAFTSPKHSIEIHAARFRQAEGMLYRVDKCTACRKYRLYKSNGTASDGYVGEWQTKPIQLG